MLAEIDHIVIGCARLDEGVERVRAALGVAPAHYGAHHQMGTHNALWSLGTCYLEVISIDPKAKAPAHRRWFGLDSPDIQARLRKGPALLTWVARVADLSQAKPQFGRVMSLSRDALRWQLTVPEDGEMPMGGCLPALIQWPVGTSTPTDSLRDSGLRLQSLNLPDRTQLRAAMPDMAAGQPVGFGPQEGLEVKIERGDGTRLEWDQHTAI